MSYAYTRNADPDLITHVELPLLTFGILAERASKGWHKTNADGGELPCPWCGYEHGDVFEYRHAETTQCSECFGEFVVYRECGCETTAERGARGPRFICVDPLDVNVDDGLEGHPAPACALARLAPPLRIEGCTDFEPEHPECVGSRTIAPLPLPEWRGTPVPETWATFGWPAWVPERVWRRVIENCASPRAWLVAMRDHGYPPLGERLTLAREGRTGGPLSPLDTVTGRFVPPTHYGGSGLLVFRDGRTWPATNVSMHPIPYVSRGPYYRACAR